MADTPKSLTGRGVRRAFLDYFKRNGHEELRSSSLLPHGDPTLLFTNAGMNQFKDVFTGREKRPYKRATTAQKCVRAGGKHNDLENVGRTARHHTFFEMLGNFSFGDYFKAEAIEYAWTLLTRELALDAARLMITVFGGDQERQLAADDEARSLWRRIAGLPDDRILGLGLKDNFWMMGDTGPQGPCTEIHFHQGDDLPCPEPVCKGPACDCDRWLEIWNLVFMQYERKEAGGPLAELPAKSIDTGAGLERMTAVLEGKRSNYDTDLFAPLLAKAAELARNPARDEEDRVSLRVIADHARATAFLIADGVFPDKTGREYVLRRIFRRAVRHGKRLGIDEPFMHVMCGVVADQMGADYPELVEKRAVIEQVALKEEIQFRATLDRGLRLLDDEFARMDQSGEKQVPGATVFKLYDTYGFPADLTRVVAEERHKTVDEAGFERLMEAQRGRGEFEGSGEARVADVFKRVAEEIGAVEFVGYQGDGVTGKSEIVALLAGSERSPTEKATTGQEVAVVTRATPFYGESGGQVGDTGEIAGPNGRVHVDDTQRPVEGLIVHLGKVVSGTIARGEPALLRVEVERRSAIRYNHSATHLLHHALRRVLGEHVTQKGSLVAPDRLRFDFSHFAPMTDDEKRRVEDLVNAEIRKNRDSRTEVLPFDEARKAGAMALFGEKYGDRVRVVRIGDESVELCGGTHVGRAGDIGLFKITAETGIAQGVRRIEAVTGPGAVDYVRRLEAELQRAAGLLRGASFEVGTRVERLQKDLRDREKEIDALKRKLAGGGGRDLLSQVKQVAGVKVLSARSDVADPKALREVSDQLRDKIGSGIVVLGGEAEGKVSLIAVVTKDLLERGFHAGKLIGEVAKEVGGKGGGRPDMAQAGGTQPENLDRALARVDEIVGAQAKG
jgi:alanyl-tRNA synthetase